MNYLQFKGEATDSATSGNKASRLAELSAAGFRVPPFFVVKPSACVDAALEAGSDLRRQIDEALRRLCPNGTPVAVRSSSTEEDGSQASFAGQFDSYLNVAHANVCDHVALVWESADSTHIQSYREARTDCASSTVRPAVPAVLVQRMVQADAAGVAFAVDPVTGNSDCAVVAATRGLGDALVNGDCQGDSWHVNRHGRICQRQVSGDSRGSLSDRQIRKVAALVREVTLHYGRPQDIEWAIRRGRIYLLQSRDITSLKETSGDGNYALWDNSNIVESYGGVTTPLTFSVARSAYAEAYRHFGRVIGIGESVIEAHSRTYEQMIGLHDGRVYYNLLNWYRLLMLTPGFRFNRRFMEQMMGVTQSLPDSAVPQPQSGSRFAGLRATLGIIRVGWRLTVRLVMHGRDVARFHQALDAALARVDLEEMSLQQLADTYEQLQAAVIPRWDTPLVNDLYCMIFHGLLRKLCDRWLPEELAEVHNDLVSGEAGIVSLEPVHRMQELADIARTDASLCAALLDAPLEEVRRAISRNEAFSQLFEDFVERFGDRCMDELKLESPTLADDPLQVLRTVALLARKDRVTSSAGDASREPAENKVSASLQQKPFRRLLFRAILSLARARVRDRENLRFERTRVYGRVRSIFVEMGQRLQEKEVIERHDDIFFLDVDEVLRLVHGTSSSVAVKGTVAARRNEFATYRNTPDLPRRFMTCGPAQLATSRQAVEPPENNAGHLHRSGQGCSPGTIRGPVRIVTDPRKANVQSGEILVAQRTDPGWVTIFPLVSGMIMERGSLLSHSAIVARELGLPCVVGVEDACNWLQDGEVVEIDGATGSIKRLGTSSNRAA